LCFGAWASFALGTLILIFSGTFFGLGFLSITLGGILVLPGCGALCPAMYGMALGLFTRNLGLLGGAVTAICYLAISATTALVAYLPQQTQAPLGWVYAVLGLFAAVLLLFSLPKKAAVSTASPREGA
jgi:DHA1 family bicyclomycin/chloramphenicol resistance-like MFS transporter